MGSVNMAECFKKHPMLHMVTGVGVGLLLVGLVPDLVVNAVTWGIVIVVLGIGAEFVLGQK